LKRAVEAALARAPAAPADPSAVSRLRGSSLKMRDLRSRIERVAPTDATVLVLGESGVGKELVARAIHAASPRAEKPMVVLNCGAIPENLMEAELFGWERGAFSGAHQAKPGLFEAANGGTIFLDEIGDLPLALQAKLLRVLQDHEVRRIGSTRGHVVDVRVIGATHRDLRALVADGKFREDLFFRLSVVEVTVPALRERKEDLPELLAFMLEEVARKHGKQVRGFSAEARAVLELHSYPGNIRELANLVERSVIFAAGDEITLADLPAHLMELVGVKARPSAVSFEIGTPLREVESELIRKSLEAAGGDKVLAAKLLGVNPRTIYRWLERETPAE
jgi:transcriptional regulator with PAS, ATPase and Fis domain